MKKIMSLLLAVSLLLCMTVMAAAATSGELTDGDNFIELPWDTREASVYTYTATRTGTLFISTVEFNYTDDGEDFYDNMDYMDEWKQYVELTVDGQLLEGYYYGQVEVVEGQTYTFSWRHHPDVADEKWYDLGWQAVLNLSYDDELVPQKGTADLPVELHTEHCPADSMEVPAGETVYYLLYDFAGAHFTVTGQNAYVVVEHFDMMLGQMVVTRYNAKGGVVTVPVETYYVTVQIGNAGKEAAVFSLDYYYPLGSPENPAQVVEGNNVAETEAENYDGYYFTFTAECDGTLTLTLPEIGWMYSVSNSSGNLDVFGVAGEEGVENPLVVEVKQGDVVTINLNSFDSKSLTVPGGKVVMNAKITYQHSYENGKCAHCGAEEVQTQVKLGDVNGDGRVNTRDARALLLYVAGILTEDDMILEVADVTGDHRVNVRDARQLLLWAVGL